MSASSPITANFIREVNDVSLIVVFFSKATDYYGCGHGTHVGWLLPRWGGKSTFDWGKII